MGSLMLLDTASLYFRAYFGVPDTVRSPDGTPVNAVRGLLDMITRLARARPPARLVACWDADWRPAFRVAAVPSYKAHRLAADGTSEEIPPELAVQIPVIEEVLRAAGLAVAGQPGFEADDVIATLAARSADPVDVVTGDRVRRAGGQGADHIVGLEPWLSGDDQPGCQQHLLDQRNLRG